MKVTEVGPLGVLGVTVEIVVARLVEIKVEV